MIPPVEDIRSHGCVLTLRQFEGPEAAELFFSCRPPAGADSRLQATAACTAILDVLQGKGATYADVVTETCFLRDLSTDLAALRDARQRVLIGAGELTQPPAIMEVVQPPLNSQHALEILVHAVVPFRAPVQKETHSAETACGCPECAELHASLVRIGSESRLCAGNILGAGATAFEQTTNMFELAESLLRHAGMAFSDVMRTWIYFPEMERDYAAFNKARRQFFESRCVDPVPASTGIGAGLIAPEHQLCLGIYAVKSDPPTQRTVMTTPTLNEAPEYGSDFSRGMRVQEANKVSLLVSGTASLDETGETVCVGDLEGQARRMLLNVEALLQAQGAGFSDVVSAITYVKYPQDAPKLQAIFQDAGYVGFPNVLVAAEVCRPELLCETELLAVLPADRGRP